MHIDFSKLFHQSSKDLRGGGTVNIPQDSKEWPEEWSTIHYKTYARFKKIPLNTSCPKAQLADAITKRQTGRDFKRVPVTKDTISALLKYSCGITRGQSRAQASGGGIFPLEVYPLIFSGSDEIPAGLYHYNVKEHALDVLWERPFTKADIADLFAYQWVQNASFALVITAVFYRMQMKYGERGYRYILLEAGHIGQNVYLNAVALGLKCGALGGTWDENVEKLIDIDGTGESVVYALALG